MVGLKCDIRNIRHHNFHVPIELFVSLNLSFSLVHIPFKLKHDKSMGCFDCKNHEAIDTPNKQQSIHSHHNR